ADHRRRWRGDRGGFERDPDSEVPIAANPSSAAKVSAAGSAGDLEVRDEAAEREKTISAHGGQAGEVGPHWLYIALGKRLAPEPDLERAVESAAKRRTQRQQRQPHALVPELEAVSSR